MTGSGPELQRRLGTVDAVIIGLGSMIGAGVFAVFAPAAAIAGSGLLIGLAIASVVAYANATSSAQLAATYPSAGGTYVYGRERLGPWWGFLAGWGFVVGKTASVAAMAMTFAASVVPAAWQRPIAALAIITLSAVNYRGITRTALLTRVIVVVVLGVLALVVAFGAVTVTDRGGVLDSWAICDGGVGAVLQSSGLIFFAFAGYARLATLGEEVRNPARTIPRAIVVALLLVVLIYAAVAITVLNVLGASGTASSSAPVVDAAAVAGGVGLAIVARVGASAASLGALLALVAGVGRTGLAMARGGDLPRWLAAVHPKHHTPHHADLALAVAATAVVLLVDLRGAIAFSSFGVLVYYLIANVSALTQPAEQRRFPRAVAVLGAVGCVTLVVTLPVGAVLGGVLVFAVGIGYRLFRLAWGRMAG